MRMALVPPPLAQVPLTTSVVTSPMATASVLVRSNGMNTNIAQWAADNEQSVIDSSSVSVSVQAYQKPTKEEIEQKKRNFNFWFWGGGFVAPCLATFYYFGFKFWER
jgi:hypothetical protein